MQIKCNKCGYIGERSEFPTGYDFFQIPFVNGCPKNCGNLQSPGDASLRMMPSQEHPFTYLRSKPNGPPIVDVLHDANEAS